VPRLAHRLERSGVGDAFALDARDGRVRGQRWVYGAKAETTIELTPSPAVLWLRARTSQPAASGSRSPATVPKTSLTLAANDRTRIIERKSEATGEARLEDASVIVSGGRGLGGPTAFEELKTLAALLNAQVAASRAACDSGWCPPSWQVGQTGKKVAPALYLAVAIRGASQHMAGISDAKNIAAINIDPDAPIFKSCRFGIIEDYKKIIPLLKERLAALQK